MTALIKKLIFSDFSLHETEILNFLSQFYTLLQAGIPIIQSCEILQQSQKNVTLRIMIFSIKNDLLSGKNLSQSLKKYESHFGYYFLQLILIGETTGTLPERLKQISHHLKKKINFKDKIKQMCLYPCIISFSAIAMTILMLVFVIPRFAEIFKNSLEQLPALTQFIFFISEIIRQKSIFILIFCILFFITLFQVKNNSIFRKYAVKNLSRVPLLKQIIHKILLNYFCINFSTLLEAGIPILDALKILHKTGEDNELVHTIYSLKLKINAGSTLNQAMSQILFFPSFMIQMVKIGEESGMLEKMLEQVADILEKEINQTIHLIIQFLEPLIMLMLGVLIGGLIIAMYLPIFKLGNMI